MGITRREFTLSAGALAASPFLGSAHSGQDTSPANGRKLRYCIVGLGHISMDHFMPACKMSQSSQVTALVSGDRKKAEAQAAQYGIQAESIYNYKNYDEIGDSSDIDAVYIALPNSMHTEYTIRAANAGKHVLCEKPMATTVKDCQAMINACRAASKS